MPNVTISKQLERRTKIKKLWIKGVRNFSELARLANCGLDTVKRDLVILRKQARKKKVNARLDLLRLEIDHQYLAEMVSTEDLIQKALRISGIQKIKVKDDKTVEKSRETSDPHYNAIVGLKKLKVDLITKRAELWGLIQKGGFNLNVKAEAKAQANAEAKTNVFSNISESDIRKIIELANSLNPESGQSGKNRISPSEFE